MDHGAVDVGEEDGAEETGVRSAGALHRRNSSSASVLLSPFVSGGGRLSDAPRKAILSGECRRAGRSLGARWGARTASQHSWGKRHRYRRHRYRRIEAPRGIDIELSKYRSID